MARERSPERQRALRLWLKSDRQLKPSEIAAKLGIDAGLVRKWKSLDGWDKLPDPKRGAPIGNRNAKGNKGGGAPPGNQNALVHGLFSKILPDDPEMMEIFAVTERISTLELLWTQIRIAWTNLMRSQKIMYVRDKDDITKEIKKVEMYSNDEEVSEKQEWEIQFAWDKQGRALAAQTAAMSKISSMIKQYEAMIRALPPDEVQEEQRLRVERLKGEVKKLAPPNDEDNGLTIMVDYGDGADGNSQGTV